MPWLRVVPLGNLIGQAQMGINNYVGEFIVALGAVFTSAALLRLGQVRRAKMRNRISPVADDETLLTRWGVLAAGLLFLPVGCAILLLR